VSDKSLFFHQVTARVMVSA